MLGIRAHGTGSEVTYTAEFAFKGSARFAAPVVAAYLPFLARKTVDELKSCLDRLPSQLRDRARCPSGRSTRRWTGRWCSATPRSACGCAARCPAGRPTRAPVRSTGKDVLVTGASSGLGIATAEGLAALGATVHLVVRDEVKGARVRDEIAARQPGASLRIWRCDVGDLDDVRRFAADIGASCAPSTPSCTTPA